MTERCDGWELDGLIAVGGLGELWRARRGGETAALKRLHTHLLRSDDIRAQFKLEQRLARELPRHPNVVHAIDAGEVSGRPYLALGLAPGEELRRLLSAPDAPDARPAPPAPRPRVLLPRARVMAILGATCDAASHLHAAGYVHGDIHPGNLVVTTDDHVTLVDLGVARAIGVAGSVRGTAAYMAPEQVRGEAWTEATDVFALGVVLWELVAGERLFHRGPPWLTMAAVVEAPVPALEDPALDAIAQAALAKAPAARIATAGELAERLRALQTSSARAR